MAKINKGDLLPPTMVCHPASTLKDVARWLEIEARFYRKEHNSDGANSLLSAARRLRLIADGKSPLAAFEWPQIPGSAK